jgi:hypothetical protein
MAAGGASPGGSAGERARVLGNVVVGCVGNYSAAVDYFPDKVRADVARDFSVTYYPSYKIVNNSFIGEAYLLYQCGTPIPAGPCVCLYLWVYVPWCMCICTLVHVYVC